MTVKEFVYHFFLPEININRKYKRDVLFKLCQREENGTVHLDDPKWLWRGCLGQPAELYDKEVVNFWVETWSRTNHYVVWTIYND